MPMMHRENIQNFRLVGGGKNRSYTNNTGASQRNVKNSNKNNAVDGESTAISGGEVLAEKIPPPTAQQLIIHIIRSSIPMIGMWAFVFVQI